MYGGRENYDAVEFLKHMNSVITGRGENIMMIAEESTAWPGVSSPPEYGGLGFNLKWNMGWMNDFLQYISKDPVYRKYHHGNLTFSMVYAWTERFILVLSHDEVVHGKRSLIEKMPGDDWRRFANLRLACGFMFTHPGKKLLFMGSEFGQYAEWTEYKSLDWHLLDNPNNKNMLEYSRDLNALYKSRPALWTYDFDDRGFEWIDCNDADRSLLSYARKCEGETILVVANFTPVPLTQHRVGVPKPGVYEEIFNSDDEKYGGGGVINTALIKSSKEPWNFRDNSIELRIPPLGITVLKLK